MAQNMAVSVTLRLQDQFTGPVRALMQQMQGLTRAAQEFNRALGGTGSNTTFGRIQSQARALTNDVRQLTNQFQQLSRSMGAQSGGGFAGGQVANMRQLLQLQQQALANQNRLAGGGGARGPTPAGSSRWGGGFWGNRSGFSPNASLVDRAQHRAVGLGERSLVEGFFDLDRPRTQLEMLTRARPGHQAVLTREDLGAAEAAAAELSTTFRSLSRGHILETFRELVPMFNRVDDAFALLPEMLRIQDWQVLQGDTAEKAREGMLSLLRAVGLSGRLIGPDGRLKLDEASGFMDSYLRARMIGGRDITPDQVFQFMKYAKATGQSLSPDALLEAFIAMPDIRGSSFGNQLNMLVRQMTGRATQAAQSAMEAAGLGRITERTQSGGHGFAPVDEELLRSDPSEWFKKHIVGATGVLRRMGIDPMRANSAQIATGLSRFFSNQSAENIANMIVNQQTEWRNQVLNALGIDLSELARRQHTAGSGWHQLQAGRSGLQDVLGAVGENFKRLLNPALEAATDGLKKLARWIDPTTGSPLLSTGVLAGGGIAAFMMARNILRMMGPVPRMLIGGGLGYMLGGPTEALMGALIGRGMGAAAGGSAAGAAGAAGAVAGAAFGGRFLGAVRFIARGIGTLLKGSIIWGAVGFGITQIIDNWEAVRTRLLAIWEDMKQAAPVWAGGEGKGWRAIAQGPAMAQTGRELETYLQGNERGLQDWVRGTALGQWLISNGLAMSDDQMAHRRLTADYSAMGIDLPALEADARARAAVPGNIVTVASGAVTINITTPPGADANAIGEAAGNAVQSQLRGLMTDLPPMP